MGGSLRLACLAALAAASVGAAPAGGLQRVSPVIETPDGVALAADVILPPGNGGRVPAMLVMTPYGRASRFSPRAIEALGAAGFAVVLADVRGTGASQGVVQSIFSRTERADIRTVLDWIARQPWSDGRVVATGASYDGNLASLAAASGDPVLKAAVSRFVDFDTYRDLAVPGGVRNEALLKGWGELTLALNLSTSCLQQASGCAAPDAPRPVDGDRGYRRLREALLDHQRDWRPYEDTRGYQFYDDVAPSGERLSDGFLSNAAGLRGDKAALQIWGSWTDAGTADSAIALFRRAQRAPAEVYIGAWPHGGVRLADPLRSGGDGGALVPPAAIVAFARAAVDGRATGRTIHYYVMGAGDWRTTDVWPPRSVSERAWRLAADHGLGASPSAPAVVEYAVDFDASTGRTNRWATQLTEGPVDYGDRAAADAKLSVFTSAPIATDLEIIGTPRMTLSMSSSSPDGAVFVYLEAVSPDGRVHYLTEGEQRLSLGRGASAADPAAGFRRADMAPQFPGRVQTLAIPLRSVAARVPAGWRLRVALAGADRDTFARYPAEGTSSWSIRVGGEDGSRLMLPENRSGGAT